MRSASPSATVSDMTRTLQRLWPVAKRYWFDALLVAGIGVSIAVAVADQHTKNGPDGPLWFDVLASVAFLVPFFFRRRYPFGAPAAVGVLIAAISFVDSGLINDEFVAFLSGITAAFMFGMLQGPDAGSCRRGDSGRRRSRSSLTTRETIPGTSAFRWSSSASPGSSGSASARSSMRRTRRRSGQIGSSGSERSRRVSRSPRSGRESLVSCTTSSATASAS